MTATTETKTYTLEERMYDDYFAPKFAFHATSVEDASGKASKWAHYHSFANTDVRVREATEREATHWLHNEYIEYTSCGR